MHVGNLIYLTMNQTDSDNDSASNEQETNDKMHVSVTVTVSDTRIHLKLKLFTKPIVNLEVWIDCFLCSDTTKIFCGVS